LPGDDQICARMLGCDVRKWRSIRAKLRARLLVEVDPVLGTILRQKRIARDWVYAAEQTAKNKARTAPATAERRRKAAERRNVTVEAEDDRHVDREPDRSDPVPAISRVEPEPYKRGPASGSQQQATPGLSTEAGALRSATPLADAIRAKRVAEGRSPPATGSSLFERLNAAEEGQ
jgi:uncharacterized protein YdaU (DUF1376 family)